MDCTIARTRLVGYIDDELPEDERRAVEAHLATCEACRAEWMLLREVGEAMATWPVLAEPQGLAARVMGEIRASEARPARPRVRLHARSHVHLWAFFRLRWQGAVLTLALALTVVLLVLSARYTWVAGAVEARALDLQVQRSVSVLQRAWYAARADVGRMGMDAGHVFSWVSGALVLAAAAIAVVVLATQARTLRV